MAGLRVQPRALEQHSVLGKAASGIHMGVLDDRAKLNRLYVPDGYNPAPPKPRAELTSQAAGAGGDIQQLWGWQAARPVPSAQVEPSQLPCWLALAVIGVVTGAPPPFTRGREKISFLQNSSHQALLLQHDVRKDG